MFLCGFEPTEAFFGSVHIEGKAVPAVTMGHRTLERLGGHAAKNNRRTGLLDWLGKCLDAAERGKLPLMGRVVLTPNRPHGINVIERARSLMTERGSEGVKFRPEIANADAKDQASARKHIQAGHLFCQHQRIPLRQDNNAGSHADGFGLTGQKGKGNIGVEHGIGWRQGRRRLLRVR